MKTLTISDLNALPKLLNAEKYTLLESRSKTILRPFCVTGERLLELKELPQLEVNINPILTGNSATLRFKKLCVSKEVWPYMANPETALETFKGLSITLL